ncbi:uncharacterized protein LOC142585399 isoform X2 [Dermacentor variabilis]|uniref:uncharacterized protein LOC142585399 isoform X2 n=1 Tax=Dermacentor variabilis TaxID=34621 RepID=UPI003F5C767A
MTAADAGGSGGGTMGDAPFGASAARAMDLDLSNLTLAERDAIMQVLQRDQALRKMEERRILHLKAELQRLRKRGALRPGLDPARSCARCLSALGRILNRGAPCPSCRKKVCRDCRLHEVGVPEGSDQWLCVVCHKQMELKATSGQWMQDLCRRSSRRRKLNGPPVADELGRALQCVPAQQRPDHAGRPAIERATSSRAAAAAPASATHQQPQQQSARGLGNHSGPKTTPPMTRTTPSPDAQRPPLARLPGGYSSAPRPDSPQSAVGQDSLSSDVSSAADSSATPFPASSATTSKPTSEGTPPLSSTACPSPPTGVRWAPLRGPLRTPIRKLPRQGSSLSSSSDSASAEGGVGGRLLPHHHQQPPLSSSTTAADDSPPPVPFPRTKRQSPQRQLPPSPMPQDSPSPPTQKQLLVPDSKIPLAPSLSAPASPAFRDRSRSALTVTYSSPPSVQDGRGQTLPARKATAPELTGLERAKEVAFRRVTLGSVRMESSSTTDDDDAADCCSGEGSGGGSGGDSLAINALPPSNECSQFPILPPPLVFDDFLLCEPSCAGAHAATAASANNPTLGDALSFSTNVPPSPPCSPLARRLDQLRRRSLRIRDLLKGCESAAAGAAASSSAASDQWPSRPASQNSYDSRLWPLDSDYPSDCEVKLRDRSPDDYKLVFISSSESSEDDSEVEAASRLWLLLRSRLAVGPEGAVYVEDSSDWEFPSDEEEDGGGSGGSEEELAPGEEQEQRERLGVVPAASAAGPQVVDPGQRSPEEARSGEEGESSAAGPMGRRRGGKRSAAAGGSDASDEGTSLASHGEAAAAAAAVAILAGPDNRNDEDDANLLLAAVRDAAAAAGVGEPGQEVLPAAAPPVVDSAPEVGEEATSSDGGAIAGPWRWWRRDGSLARDDAIMEGRVPLSAPEEALGPGRDVPAEDDSCQGERAPSPGHDCADNAPVSAANMADLEESTGGGGGGGGQGVLGEVGQPEENGAPARTPPMSAVGDACGPPPRDAAGSADSVCVEVQQQVVVVPACVSDREQQNTDNPEKDTAAGECVAPSAAVVDEAEPKSSDRDTIDGAAAPNDDAKVEPATTPARELRERDIDLEGLVVSTLEKYFTESFDCHETRPPSAEAAAAGSPKRDGDVGESSRSGQSPTAGPTSCDTSDASCDEEEEEENMFSDASTSSDDAMYISPMPRFNAMQYGNPLSYSLHTILEESCEESEKSSRATTPVTKNPSSELEKYFSFAIGNASLEEIHKRWSIATSEDFSDSVSETSGVDDVEVLEEDPEELASSRLEKYFTSGLLGTGKFHYPDDAEFTDESGGVSSDDEDKRATSKQKRAEKAAASLAFEGGDSCDTIKRKKKDDGEEAADIKVVLEEEGFTTIKRKKEDALEVQPHDVANNTSDCNTVNEEQQHSQDISFENLDVTLTADESTIIHMDSTTEDDFHDAATKDANLQTEDNRMSLTPTSEANTDMQQSLSDSANELTSGIESMCNSSTSELTQNEDVKDLKKSALEEDAASIHSRSSSTDCYSDEEAAYIVNRVLAHISGTSDETEKVDENITPWKALLESQITRLMQTVSPAALSGESSCSSTIGSNNSDYGSDTLESGTYSSTDEEGSPKPRHHKKPGRRSPSKQLSAAVDDKLADNLSGHSNDSTISEETMFICRQLMQSLKMLSDEQSNKDEKSSCPIISDHNHNDYMKAQEYIQYQIVALMHTVGGSRNASPLRERRCKPLALTGGSSECSDVDSPNLSEKKKMGKSKTPSESGSETISTSISIPSYDSDHTATESEMSNEMDELYNMLESSGATLADNISLSKLSCCDGEEPSDHFILPPFKVPVLRLQSGQEVPLIAAKEAASNLEFLEPSCILPKLSTVTVEEKLELPGMFSIASGTAAKCDSSSTLTTGSDIDFCGSVETVLEVCPKTTGMSPEPSVSPTETSADKSRSESSLYIKARRGLGQRKLVVTRSSDSLAPYKKAGSLSLQLFHSKGASKSEHSILDTAAHEDKEVPSEASQGADGLGKRISGKEKSCSENNLSLATFSDSERSTSKFLGTKSVGNIADLEGNPGKTFRDTGYYSFKSSEESVLSLDEQGSRPPSGCLTKQKSVQSSETIPEVEEEPVRPARSSPGSPTKGNSNSLSSGSIPDSVFVTNSTSDCKSSTLPSSLRSKVNRPNPHSSSMVLRQRHFSSTFFSTSGVLRKLTALKADDSSGSHRSSPRGRLRGRSRHSSGGSDDSNRLLPTIAIVGAEESSSVKSSADSMDRDSSHRDDELERIYSRSQTSLSSIGVSMRSESMTSVYSAAGGGRYGTVAVTGEVLFSILYNYKSGLLEVHVRECRNLAPVDTKRNRSDPYVKVYLLPDKTKSGKRKTKVKKHTLNPVFEEVLKFRVTMSELQARTLWLSVWHSDMFGRNDFLGEVMLPLTYETLEKTEVRCFALQERFECPEVPLSYKGDILLALKYMPPDVTNRSIKQGPVRGSLHVLVKEARNLTATRSNGTSDPFCKSYLLPDRTKGSKQKTPVVKKCCNPKWNHTFVYPDVSLDELKDRCLELTIWDYDKITSNDFLGGVRLGLGTGKLYGRDVDWMDSHGEEVILWRSMLERPNLWIDGSLLLRPTMQSKR